MDLPLVCPVCAAQFPAAGGAAFALHVADCTSPSPSALPTSTLSADPASATTRAACAICHHVYARGTAPHVIEFHEHECARANRRNASTSKGKSKQQGKRPRESPTASSSATDTPQPLFPPHCALCGAGGRALLLRCGGGCARAFHVTCIDDVQAGNSRAPAASTVTGLAGAATAWCCAECARGVHACAACGFLGHESNTLVQCAAPSCGFFLHRAAPCRPGDATAAFVCPRHTCDVCGAVEPDMRACESCTKCFAGAHLRCRKGEGAKSLSLRSSSGTAETNLRICDAHAGGSKPSTEETLALRYRVQQGDLVLLLEFANAILPQSAKNAAPDAFNQWGVVTRAEDVDGRDQLLSVSVFSDGSVLSVPNKYVLPLGSVNAFSTPQAMLRDCIKWHAVTEFNLRRTELDTLLADNGSDAQKKLAEARDHILNASCSAFYARAEKLALSISQLFGAAKEGYTFWTTHRAELQQFAGSGAPIYVFMDTRAPPKSENKADGNRKSGSADDVNMEGAAGGEGKDKGGASNASSSSPSQSSPDRTFLRAGTNASRRPMQQGEKKETEVVGASGANHMEEQEGASTLSISSCSEAAQAVEAAAAAASMTVIVAEALSDLVTSVERDGTARTQGPNDANEQQMDVDDEPAATTTGTLAAAAATTESSRSNSSSSVKMGVAESMEGEGNSADEKMAASGSVSPMLKTIVEMVEVTVVPRVDSRSSSDSNSNNSSSNNSSSVGESSAKVEFAAAKKEQEEAAADADLERAPKRPKLVHLSEQEGKQQPQSISVAAAKAPPSSLSAMNMFAREKQSFELQAAKHKQALTRKERVLAEYSPQLLQELGRQAAMFLEEEANPTLARRSRKAANPKHSDAFPFASSAASFRPPYFRPSVVFNRGVGRRLDGLSRILLSQDKRNIKCFIQGTNENRCLHEPTTALGGLGATAAAQPRMVRSEGTFVTIDLMSVDSFRTLEMVIHTRMIAAVEQDDRYLKEIFGANAALARRLFKEKRSGGPAIEIYYCSYDGSRSKVARDKDDWLCFCANVCHLTVVVPLNASLQQQQ